MWGFINITPHIFKAFGPYNKNYSQLWTMISDYRLLSLLRQSSLCMVFKRGTASRTNTIIITVRHFISKLAGPLGQSTLTRSMFWNSWCFGVVSVLAQLMFWHGRCFSVVNVLAQSMFWQGRGFGTVDVWGASLNVTCKVYGKPLCLA